MDDNGEPTMTIPYAPHISPEVKQTSVWNSFLQAFNVNTICSIHRVLSTMVLGVATSSESFAQEALEEHREYIRP